MSNTQLTPPERTHDQRLAALAHANEIRVYRAGIKAEIMQAHVDLIDLRDDPQMQTAKVIDFLRCVPKIGKVKASRAMQAAGCSPSKTFAGMTEGQWRTLTAVLWSRGPSYWSYQRQVEQYQSNNTEEKIAA